MQSSLLAKPATMGAFVYSAVSRRPAYCLPTALPRSFRAVMTRSRSLQPTEAVSHFCVVSVTAFQPCCSLKFQVPPAYKQIQTIPPATCCSRLHIFHYPLFNSQTFSSSFWRGGVFYSLPPSHLHFPPFASSLLFLPEFGENNFNHIFLL